MPFFEAALAIAFGGFVLAGCSSEGSDVTQAPERRAHGPVAVQPGGSGDRPYYGTPSFNKPLDKNLGRLTLKLARLALS